MRTKEIATTALAGAMTVGAVNGIYAQEARPSTEPILQLNPSLELTTLTNPCIAHIASESPIPSAAPEILLSNGDTLIYESPTSSNLNISEDGKSTFEQITDIINSSDLPACDIYILRDNILAYYENDPDESKRIYELYLANPDIILQNTINELEKQKKNKRDAVVVSTGFGMLLSTLAETKNSQLIEYIIGYIGATNNKMSEKYIETNSLILESNHAFLSSESR